MAMTKEEARAKLDALNAVISTAVMLIAGERETLDQFIAEQESMNSVGPLLDPTLFNSSERRTVEAIVTPIYSAARELVRAYEAQICKAAAALQKVKGHG